MATTSQFGKPRQATPEENRRYRQGLCMWCGGKPAAGMPRCTKCHHRYERGFRG